MVRLVLNKNGVVQVIIARTSMVNSFFEMSLGRRYETLRITVAVPRAQPFSMEKGLTMVKELENTFYSSTLLSIIVECKRIIGLED